MCIKHYNIQYSFVHLMGTIRRFQKHVELVCRLLLRVPYASLSSYKASLFSLRLLRWTIDRDAIHFQKRKNIMIGDNDWKDNILTEKLNEIQIPIQMIEKWNCSNCWNYGFTVTVKSVYGIDYSYRCIWLVCIYLATRIRKVTSK